MPIILIWNAAASPFGPQVGRWLDEMARSTSLLSGWLRKRLVEAERLDRMSFDWPVLRFYEGAVTVRIVRSQFGLLLTEPVASVGAHVERSLGQWNIPEDVRVQARSADLPLAALRILDEIAAGILASIDRFASPEAQMFDPYKRNAADLIGLLALAYRTVGTDRDALFDTATMLRDERDKQRLWSQLRAPRGGGGGGGDANPGVLPLDMRIDEITRYVVGALLVIPALSELLVTIGRDALVVLRYRLLDELEKIEAAAHGFRRRLFLDLRNGMAAFAEATLQFMARASGLAVRYISAFVGIGIDYLRGVAEGVGAFSDQLGVMWTGVIDLVNKVVAYGTALVNVDIGEVIHKALVAVEEAMDLLWWVHELYNDLDEYEAPDQFPVTIGELVMNEGPGVRANIEIRSALRKLSAGVEEANVINLARWVSSGAEDAIGPRLKGMRLLVDALDLPRAALAAQQVLVYDAKNQPDLVAKVIKPLRGGLEGAVARVGTSANAAVGGIVDAARTGLGQTAETFAAAATEAAATRPVGLLNRMTGNVDGLVDGLLGDQKQARRTTAFDPVAKAFEGWLLQGGFDIVGRAASGFIAYMLDLWTEDRAAGRDTPVAVGPTSPRKLLERARLGRVHVPRLRIVATRSPVGRDLAQRVAVEFRSAVQGAYGTGLERLGRYAAEAAP